MNYNFNYLKQKTYNSNLSRVIPKTPIIFQTENTPLENILANPLKKTIFYGVFSITLYIILGMCNIIYFKNFFCKLIPTARSPVRKVK